MTRSPEMNTRSRAILLEVVNDYIATGEPVGSRTVSRRHTERLSPATIRNVMSDLEEMGFLEQPHVSAGRVPTDRGYRFYVDHLLSPASALASESGVANEYACEAGAQNIEGLLERACNSLSANSRQAGLVMMPHADGMRIKLIEFIKVGRLEVLAVFVSEMGVLQKKLILVDEELSQEELASFAAYLNHEFSGKSLREVRLEIFRRMRDEREHYDRLMNNAMKLWTHAFMDDESPGGDVLVDGKINLLDCPDFVSDLEAMKVLLKALEEKKKLIRILDMCLHQDGVSVIIGRENSEEGMSACSVIAQSYRLANRKLGVMAVIGPRRMDYRRVIALVNGTAQSVSRILSERVAGG